VSTDAGSFVDAGASPDAQVSPDGGAYACTPPTEVPDPWEITFRPYNLANGAAVVDALLEIRDEDDSVLASGPSDGSGEVSLQVATGGSPLSGAFTATRTGFMTTRFRIQGGLGWFDGWLTMMANEGWADTLVQDQFGEPRDPSKAIVNIALFDCNQGNENWGLQDATVAISSATSTASKVVYRDLNWSPDPSLGATSRTGGLIVANLPPGETLFVVTVGGRETTYRYELRAGYWEALILYPLGNDERVCRPQDVSGFSPDWRPAAGAAQDVCSAAQIDSLAGACFGVFASETTCDAFKTDPANAGCLACAITAPDAPVPGALTFFEGLGGITNPNVAQCLSVFEGDPSASSCGAKRDAASQCGLSACQSVCDVDPATIGADLGRVNECLGEAFAAECQIYAAERDACAESLLGNGDPVDQCLSADGEDMASYLKRLVTLICGA
jgi:hypothetical protein